MSSIARNPVFRGFDDGVEVRHKLGYYMLLELRSLQFWISILDIIYTCSILAAFLRKHGFL